MKRSILSAFVVVASAAATVVLVAQPPEGGPRPERGPGGPRGEGREPGGPGGPGMRPAPPIVAALDADKDGTISAKEIENAAKALKTLDKNGDGKLTPEELRPEGGPEGRPGFGGGPGGPGGPGAPNADQILDRVFANAGDDGKLSKDEAPERMQQAFERMDRDSDGFVTRDEARAAFEAMRGQRGPGGPGAPGGEGRPRGPRDGEGGPRGPRDGAPREGGPRDGDTPEL